MVAPKGLLANRNITYIFTTLSAVLFDNKPSVVVTKQ